MEESNRFSRFVYKHPWVTVLAFLGLLWLINAIGYWLTGVEG